MKLKWHERVDSFLDLAQADLEQNEALNNLMLGICFRAQADPHYYPSIKLATISDSAGLILAAAMTPPHNLILHAGGKQVEKAWRLLANSLQADDLHIPGVIGPKQIVETFCRVWQQQTLCGKELISALRVYVLKIVNHRLAGPGLFRAARERDLDFLVAAWIQFHIECDLRGDLEPRKVTKRIGRLIQKNDLFVWEDQGQVVSLAAKSRSMRKGAVIGYVYTPKEVRGRGYATGCVTALSQHLLDSGYEYCALFTDLANPISNSIYQKIGYVPGGDYDSYRFSY